jgi:hypothetical protein
VASLLDYLGYSLQGNQKTTEGSSHPDRDAQFKYIQRRVEEFQLRGHEKKNTSVTSSIMEKSGRRRVIRTGTRL